MSSDMEILLIYSRDTCIGTGMALFKTSAVALGRGTLKTGARIANNNLEMNVKCHSNIAIHRM